MNGKELWALTGVRDGLIKSAQRVEADAIAYKEAGEVAKQQYAEGTGNGLRLAADRFTTILKTLNQ